MRTHYCNAIQGDLVGQRVTLCGWAQKCRDHGGVIFIDLRDREGVVQVVAEIRSEYVLQLTGLLRPRPAGTENPHLSSGALELAAESIMILNLRQPEMLARRRLRTSHEYQVVCISKGSLHSLNDYRILCHRPQFLNRLLCAFPCKM